MRNLKDQIGTHIDAAYNLARWLTKNEQDAKDAVQDAFLRAMKYVDTFKGDDLKPWFLKITRNTCYTLIKKRGAYQAFDEELHSEKEEVETPENQLIRTADITLVRVALESLAVEYREVLILRELENLSYDEISQVLDLPMGTVMSRLSRGRAQLAERIKNEK